MHNEALARLGLDVAYVPLDVAPADLPAALRSLRASQFLGLNVTLPHKQSVLTHLDAVSDLSQLLGAVNTVWWDRGRWSGTTTDPEGFLAAFQAAGHSFDGQAVAVFGNGGTARTLAFALLHLAAPRRVAVCARDPAKSQILAAEVAAKTPRRLETLDLAGFGERRGEFDVLVQATSVGMAPHSADCLLPAKWLEPGQIVYDVVYNPEETELLRRARSRGCRVVGGLGMLVHQGLASFRLWTGLIPDPEFFYAGIRRQQAETAAETRKP